MEIEELRRAEAREKTEEELSTAKLFVVESESRNTKIAEEEWAMRAQGHSPLRRARRPQPTRHQPRAQHRAEHRRKHKASSWCVSCTR